MMLNSLQIKNFLKHPTLCVQLKHTEPKSKTYKNITYISTYSN